jgi:molybdenum cofactor cytidylyltransferase
LTADRKSVRVFASIPAAGQSRRMGRPKQLLPVDGQPMLLRVIDRITSAVPDSVVVVTRSEIAAQLQLAKRPDVLLVCNDDPNTAMIDSILLGADALARKYSPVPDDGFLVLPGDFPGVSAQTIRDCVAAFQENPACVVVATHNRRRGHPVVLPVALLDRVRALAGTGGLNQLLRELGDRITELPVADPGVLRDVDTPDDYQHFDGGSPSDR